MESNNSTIKEDEYESDDSLKELIKKHKKDKVGIKLFNLTKRQIDRLTLEQIETLDYQMPEDIDMGQEEKEWYKN